VPEAGVVANVVVPHPDYVRFATHYGFRPDFCEAADPESKGVVETLVGYAKADLVVPAAASWEGLGDANQAAVAWCAEVNTREHTQTCALPDERLVAERAVLRPLPSLRPPLRRGEPRKVDRLATVRFGSARYSVPARLVGMTVEVAADDRQVVICHGDAQVARHPLVAPGEASICDDHYGGRRGNGGRPARSIRPRSHTEQAFVALGPVPSGSCGPPRQPGHPGLPASWPPSSPWSPVMARSRCWPRWNGRPSSGGSPPRTCGQCSPRDRRHPRSPTLVSRCRSWFLPSRPGRCPPTRPRCCGDRPNRASAGT
jgi:hypothetical protein